MAFCAHGHEYNESTHAACPDCNSSAPVGGGDGLVGVTVYEEGGSEGPPPVRAYTGGASSAGFRMGPAKQGGGMAAAGGGMNTVFEEDQEAVERLMGFLIITAAKEEEEFRYFRLKKGVNFVGRFGSRAAIELRDKEMSHQHALLICTNKATRVVDLDSKNGVKINGSLVDIAELKEGDVIRMGRTELVFVPFSFVADD